jgi:hypothetical protein
MKQNKTSKPALPAGRYFKYAIGEIMLVVVGILIALQINNWNEQKNKEAKITKILKEIQNDIQIDLIQANRMFDYQLYTDSISKGVFNNKFTEEDYRTRRINKIGYNYRDFKIVTNGFENLKGNIDNVPQKYEDLLPAIKNIYVRLKTDIDVANTMIRENVYKTVDASYNFDFAQEALKGIVTEAEIDYVLHNKGYKNSVANYMNYRRNIFALSNEYRVATIDLYLKINEALGREDTIPEGINYNYKKVTPINDYAGSYTLKETVNSGFWPKTMTIADSNAQLNMQSNKRGTSKLFYYNETTFFTDDNYGCVVFNRPKKNQFYITGGSNTYAVYEKISSK